MTEDEARAWLTERLDVPRGTSERIERFIAYLRAEAESQNLIARSTMDSIWARHIVDSAQLRLHAGQGGTWLDLGSGAGFPGLIVAMLSPFRVTLVEERRKRIDFLQGAIDLLGLGATTRVAAGRAETIPAEACDTISARAFAPLDRLFAIGSRFSHPETRWLLPKGRGAQAELEAAQRTWQGDFRIEPSVTDPESAIIVAEQVRPRRQR